MEDFDWVREISNDFIEGQQYSIKSGNNWTDYEFVKFEPHHKYDDNNETFPVYIFKDIHGSSSKTTFSKKYLDDLKSKGYVRSFEDGFNFESLFNWGEISDIDNNSNGFSIYFRDGVNIEETIPIQEMLLKKGFKFYHRDGIITNEDVNNKILQIQSINWDITNPSYRRMDPKQRDKKLLILVGYPDGLTWSNSFSKRRLDQEKERSTNELVHHNVVVIDGHKLLKDE